MSTPINDKAPGGAEAMSNTHQSSRDPIVTATFYGGKETGFGARNTPRGLDHDERIEGDYVIAGGYRYPIVDCTLEAYRGWNDTNIVTFECPFCVDTRRGPRGHHVRHIHGCPGSRPKVGQLLGHRLAHCADDNFPHGYILRLAEVETPEQAGQAKKAAKERR